MTEESGKLSGKVLDQELTSPYTEQWALDALKSGNFANFRLWQQQEEIALGEHPTPLEQAGFLVRQALIYRAANDLEGATTLLDRALKHAYGQDPKTEKMITTFLREVGGDEATIKALDEAKKDARRAIGARISEVQKELIDINRHDFDIAGRFGPGEEGKQKRNARSAELKTQNQALSDEKAKH